MSEEFIDLTPQELELLALLTEEMGEAIQMVGKIIRFGYDSYHPKDKTKTHNRRLLEEELGHIVVTIGLLCESNDLSDTNIEHSWEQKFETIRPYLLHQPSKIHEALKSQEERNKEKNETI